MHAGTGRTRHQWEYELGARTCLKMTEVVLHIINLGVTCMAMLICAGVALAYIDEVEDYTEDKDGRLKINYEDEHRTSDLVYDGHDYEYGKRFDAGGSRGAVGWVLSVSCVAILYHANVIHLLIRCNEFDIEKHNTIYSVTNSIFCAFIGLSSLAGGIANLIYYDDNDTLWSAVCSSFPDYDLINTPKVCQDLLIVRNCEIACAVISFISMLTYLILCIIIIWSGILIKRKCQESTVAITQPSLLASPPPCVIIAPVLSKDQPPSVLQSPSCIKKSAPADAYASKCETPEDPPPYEPAELEPPSYVTVAANNF